MEALSRPEFYSMLLKRQFDEITSTALKIESKTNLLFSFEKMALRDAVKGPEGARTFAEGLYEFVYGRGKPDQKFARWSQALEELPRKLTRVLTSGSSHLLQAPGHAGCRQGVRLRSALRFASNLGGISEPSGVRRTGA
jgi:hypothetical protein